MFDLSTAVNPVLTFWHKYTLFTDHSYYNHNEDDYGRVYVSADYGRPGSYVQVASFGGTQSDWTRVVVDLSQFAGSSTVRVQFKIIDQVDLNYTTTNRQADGWYIDDIRLETCRIGESARHRGRFKFDASRGACVGHEHGR